MTTTPSVSRTGRPRGIRPVPSAAAGVVVAILALVAAALAVDSPASAQGHDPTVCRPDDRSVGIPDSFFLDACFDGTYLVVVNRSNIPVYVDLTGDLTNAGKQRYAAGAHYASDIVTQWAPHLLVPDFQMRIKVGAGGGKVSLGYADDTGRKFEMLRQAAPFAPSILGAPDVVADWLTESDDAFVQFETCMQKPGQNFLDRAWCSTVYTGDMVFANTRLAVNGVLTIVGLRQWISILKHFVETGKDLRDLYGDLGRYYASTRTLTVGSGRAASGTKSATTPSSTGPAPGSSTPQLALHGSCTTNGGTITSTSAGFTPGGRYSIRAWYPNGSAYPLGSGAVGTVRGDGTIVWKWPCAGDPAGRYGTEVTDTATGRSTGRVGFTIGSSTSPPPPAPAPAPTTPPPPPPPARTWSEQQGSHGANTFTNPYNASGMGTKIGAYAWVAVSCKVYAPQIDSANPDGYWYRIASSPWNNNYYAVANTFWNGDVPGQTPYTHNTDFNVPNC